MYFQLTEQMHHLGASLNLFSSFCFVVLLHSWDAVDASCVFISVFVWLFLLLGVIAANCGWLGQRVSFNFKKRIQRGFAGIVICPLM